MSEKADEKVATGEGNGVAEAEKESKKRSAEASVDKPDEAQPAKKAKVEGPEGYNKYLLKGLEGVKQEALAGVLDRSAIPYARLWKQRAKDAAEVWLPADEVIAKGSCLVLDGTKVHGRVMRVHRDETEAESTAPALPEDSSKAAKTLERQVTPLHDMTYEEQLYFKSSLLNNTLKKLTNWSKMIAELASNNNSVALAWVRKAKKGPCLSLPPIHASPMVNGYRNKNEFTVGYDREGKPCVGFRYGRFADGDSSVGCADGCLHIPEIALKIARAVTEFLREHQDLQCWIAANHKGTWRMVMVRHSTAGEVMALIQYASTNSEPEKLAGILERLEAFLKQKAEAGEIQLTSLFLQEYNNVSNRADDSIPVRLAWGAELFHEKLLGLDFRISPSAFFQVNTQAAEVLNSLIRDFASSSGDDVVLDVCCGTGTIGLCVAGGAGKVVGIEMCEPAVEDAKKNEERNKVSNCVWLAGRAEDKIKEAIDTHVPAGSSCIAIVDPPREGLHWKVLKALRGANEIERIVYVACNHVNWVDQARQLCSPFDQRCCDGAPFEPVKVRGVDLFPHTPHVELLSVFERGETLARTRAAEQEAAGEGPGEGEVKAEAAEGGSAEGKPEGV